MNTEITEHIQGWVFYDAECSFCIRWMQRTRSLFLARGFHFVPLQAAWVKQRLGLNAGELFVEMKLLLANGRVLGGADALMELARSIWWAWPVWLLAQLPGMKFLLRCGYRQMAARRYCLGSKCELAPLRAKSPLKITSAFYEIP